MDPNGGRMSGGTEDQTEASDVVEDNVNVFWGEMKARGGFAFE